MRKKIVAGNWKMNKNFEEGMALVTEIVGMLNDEYQGSAEVVLIPPFTHLNAVSRMVAESKWVKSGAQNCSNHASGAYTGEVSAAMIQSVGAQYVIVGHSERRQYFNEHNDWLARKVDAVLTNQLIAIYCCGETLEEREAGKHFEVLKEQITQGLFHLTQEQMSNIVIAYEPVWAIGTGKTASTQQAQEVHAFIRNLVKEKYNDTVANELTIQYGGSVKPENAAELFASPDIDGALVGGAALQSRSFVDIVKAMP
ncbi:MAG: triose-phosphate isomerase [Bacteroidia bacterium]|jgi:triosephosphate isomerase|nr:triose-phosphate isomerase [Bacteroidia bacterium]